MRLLRSIAPLFCFALVLASAACGGREDGTARAATLDSAAPPEGPVDSIHPPEEALRRFRDGLPEARALAGGSSSREALVARFVEAVETQDTAALREMVMSRAEYAYLYYPASRFAAPPTRMLPDVLWMLMQQNSEKGIVRLLRRHGGTGMRYRRHQCEDQPAREGETRLWDRCVVTFTRGADTVTMRMFGSVIERGGAYKLVTYANDL